MDWLWILVFAGLMIVMHRFGVGCCGGHARGEDKSRAGHGGKPGSPKPTSGSDDKGKQAAA